MSTSEYNNGSIRKFLMRLINGAFEHFGNCFESLQDLVKHIGMHTNA